MGTYTVYVFCNECGDVHSMGIGISLDKGPIKKESIGDLYHGEEVPPEIVNCINNRTICPNTKKWFTQKDNQQIFIVPVSQ
jgi:hypothetical protein